MINQSGTIHINELMEESGVLFGTSGVRGLVTSMTDQLCFAYTLAFIQALGIPKGTRIAIAIDLRPSSPTVASACYAAIIHAEMNIDFCGAIPTPALAYYAEQENIPGMMITGSHIPFDRNGIKFYSAQGEITKQHEQVIKHAIVTIPKDCLSLPLPEVNLKAHNQYLTRYIDFYEKDTLNGLTIAFYEHSSVARDLLTELLVALGANVISLGKTELFVPIDTEAVSTVDIERAKNWANEYQFDVIISTDGDADRPLIGDENGQWMRGDIVGLLTAQYLHADAIATPVSCNTAIEKSAFFKSVIRTRIGSPYVIEAMESLINAGSNNVVGFEANGGFLLGSTINQNEKKLLPLCTRDAVLPILSVIALAKQKQCQLSEVALHLPSRFTSSDRIQSFATEKSKSILLNLSQSIERIEMLLSDLAGKVLKIDQTDGLRISFENEEVIHFRPSGNAPELRCYAESTTQENANKLVENALIAIQTL